METVVASNTFRPSAPSTFRTGYAGQNLDTTRVNASFSRLDITAAVLAALMALGPLAMAAWGAHFGA